MQSNSFPGSIPALDDLRDILYLDFSRNNLSGHIPQNMVRLSSLLNLNLSFSSFEGAVPLKGVFKNASGIQVSGNLKLCGADLNQFSSLGIKGTIGYAAPEYGMGGEVTTQGDVYSYGILLLELFTGRRPTDNRFSDGLNLHNFVKAAVPDQVTVIVDQSALYSEEEENNTEKDDFGSKWTHE
ncbi:hypothetical protein POM88_021550 [Heracleum sosnowskyi]|uniref:Protein kinase domain-containing protein n=1 Tax=Heracleum sosnowskyi TaxID=360622 RepID=A0AAD8IH37_9APIA|nr:hypothetical protein POM88_021550 [Heracleum sosnowskyi]